MSSTQPKRFMYVCLGVLVLTAAFLAGAFSGSAESPAGNDIAVRSGSASHGTFIAPPYYADGEQAQVSECICLVNMRQVGEPEIIMSRPSWQHLHIVPDL